LAECVSLNAVKDHLQQIRRLGGIARTAQLRNLGASTRSIKQSVSDGRLVVPRRGWVNSRDADRSAVRAIELGGSLGGASALRVHGIWADGDDLIVVTPPTASRLAPPQPGERRVWTLPRFPDGSERLWRAGVVDALLQQAAIVDRPSLVASIDSALHQQLLTSASLERLVAAPPQHLRSVRRQVDSRSMSGTETKLRLACIGAGFRVEPQASIDRVGFVDLLVEGWLIIEVDSRKHHDAPIPQHRDRVRDGNAVLGKFGSLRFDYQLVQFDLEWCMQVVLARLNSGRPA
jgi:very-short-patch-repair endonuclease